MRGNIFVSHRITSSSYIPSVRHTRLTIKTQVNESLQTPFSAPGLLTKSTFAGGVLRPSEFVKGNRFTRLLLENLHSSRVKFTVNLAVLSYCGSQLFVSKRFYVGAPVRRYKRYYLPKWRIEQSTDLLLSNIQ
jgi:hypothetical protein